MVMLLQCFAALCFYLYFHVIDCHISRRVSTCSEEDIQCKVDGSTTCSDCETYVFSSNSMPSGLIGNMEYADGIGHDHDETDRLLASADDDEGVDFPFWDETCPAASCPMPDWCEYDTVPTCSNQALDVNTLSEATLLEDLAGLNCNPYCEESQENYCADLAEMFITNHSAIKAAYCTDLFLVVWSIGLPDHDANLSTIPVPPLGYDLNYSDDDEGRRRRNLLQQGPNAPPDDEEDAGDDDEEDDNDDESIDDDGNDNGFVDEGPTGSVNRDNCAVRTTVPQYQVYRIPLNETSFGLSPIFSAVVDGGGSIPEKYSLSLAELPHSGAIGMMRNGVPIFPSHDNADYTSWEACEGDRCSSHAGRGADYHYHGDPFGEQCMYSDADYDGEGVGHPPFIGFSADGYLIYGRYTTSSQTGVDETLDVCGGHLHEDLPYHYHPSVETDLTSITPNYVGLSYTAYWVAPRFCFAGNVSIQPNFWSLNLLPAWRNGWWNYNLAIYNFTLYDRPDVGYLRPCCGTENAYVNGDASIQTTLDESSGLSEFCEDMSTSIENVNLNCTEGVIESLSFACYGTPLGSCSDNELEWDYSECCATNSFSAFDECIGLPHCSVSTEVLETSLPSACVSSSGSFVGLFRGVCNASFFT